MAEPLTSAGSAPAPARPLPWVCPKCRRKEVRRTVIPYECQRLHHGQPITVSLANLSVPRCGHCDELVFDYDAEEQIHRACQARTAALGNSNVDGQVTSRSA
jgi:phage FluMu protein Com